MDGQEIAEPASNILPPFRPHAASVREIFERIDREIRASNDLALQRTFLLAGRPVRFLVRNAALAEVLLAPFEHLPASSADPELTVTATDSSLRLPPATDGFDSLRSSEDGRYVLHSPASSGAQWCFDRETSRLVGATGPASSQSLLERSKPLHPLLEFWLGQGRFQIIHAAMAACDGHGVLFAGFNGAGKSTCALCCLRGGLDFLGDDRIALETRAEGPAIGHSLYCTTWLTPDHLARFPDLAPHGIAGDYPREPKHLLMVSRLFPRRFPASAPIRFVLLPHVTGAATTRLRPATRGEALRCLAPGCLLTGPRLGQEGLSSLARLIQHAECRWIELGSDLDSVSQVVQALVRGRENIRA